MDRGLDRRGRREERKQSLYIYLTSTSVNWRAGRQFRILRRRIPPQDCKRNDRANSFAAHFSTEALISTSRARDIPWMKAFVRKVKENREQPPSKTSAHSHHGETCRSHGRESPRFTIAHASRREQRYARVVTR